MSWSENSWQSVNSDFGKILDLPFLRELADGSLSRARFEFYIRQDALYLAEYGRVMCGIASKIDARDHKEAFLSFAGDTMAVEGALHTQYVGELQDVTAEAMSPTCMLYSTFLLSKLATAPTEIIVAAVLPCFRVYKEVGDYLLANHKIEGNAYADWINTYGGEEYAQAVAHAEKIADELALNCTEKQRQEMSKVYKICTKMEWLFWESAWQMEEWKI